MWILLPSLQENQTTVFVYFLMAIFRKASQKVFLVFLLYITKFTSYFSSFSWKSWEVEDYGCHKNEICEG